MSLVLCCFLVLCLILLITDSFQVNLYKISCLIHMMLPPHRKLMHFWYLTGYLECVLKMLSVSSCSSRARSRFRAIRGLWALYCGARPADREAVGGAAEGRMEEGRASGEESEAETSPPDSPSEAEEESGRVELARTPREPRVAKGKPPGGCLLYTSPSPRDRQKSRMPSSA